mgnify:CR=1 FL=1
MHVPNKLPKVGTTIFTVMSQLALEHQAVNLGQGFPDFPVPQRLVEELARAMAEGKNQYAPMTGIPALRQAIAAKTARCYGRAVDADAEVTVTSGASEAIFNAILALVSPGEEVIVLDPCYDCYEPAIDLAGGVAVHVPLDPQDFTVDWQRVREAISPRTRMLMINSPHNPSGAMLSPADMAALAELLRETALADKRAQRTADALLLLNTLSASPDATPDTWLLLGTLHVRENRNAEASSTLDTYLQKTEGAGDAADATEHLGPVGRADRGLHELNSAVSRGRVDASGGIRIRHSFIRSAV